jgi:hypothetical protein
MKKMWTPNFKPYTKEANIQYPVACEVKFDGEFIHWTGQALINKRKVPKKALTVLPAIPLYGELYYGDGKEYYSEIHSHEGHNNKVIVFDTFDYGHKPYIERRKDLEASGLAIVPMKICQNFVEVEAYFKEVIQNGYEGIVIKPLNSLDDSQWLKMKREYTANLIVRGLKKDKTMITAVMGTADHVYCAVNLNGWDKAIDMLREEKKEKGAAWIAGENKEVIFINSNVVLGLKHNGVIMPNEKLRHARVARICAPETQLNVQKGD